MTERLGLVEFVDWIGPVDHTELPGYYAGASLFALVSVAENFPHTLLEAMALGCPIVCSDRIPGREICGDACVLCDVSSSEAIADAIEMVLTDQMLWQWRSCALRQRSADFDWSKLGPRYGEFLGELIAMAESHPRSRKQ